MTTLLADDRLTAYGRELEAVYDDPRAFASVLELMADYLEDQDDARCEGVRWLVREGRRPVTVTDEDRAPYRWFLAGKSGYNDYKETCHWWLPFLRALPFAPALPFAYSAYFDDPLAAILDAAQAYLTNKEPKP